MDLPTLNAIIKVNGLTSQSAPENITDVLLRSGYSKDEIPKAIAILHGDAPPPAAFVPGVYVAPILEHTKTVTYIPGRSSIFAGRIGVRQFWTAGALAVGIYGIVFILIEVSAVPLFSILSGISLFAPPDLSTAPLRTLLLFGIGIGMLLLPFVFFLIVMLGLQVRRCHDYGLSASGALMAVLALIVSGYVLGKLTPLASLAAVLAIILWCIFASVPGAREDNDQGPPTVYSSVWAALRGGYDEEDNMNRFARTFIMPLLQIGRAHV